MMEPLAGNAPASPAPPPRRRRRWPWWVAGCVLLLPVLLLAGALLWTSSSSSLRQSLSLAQRFLPEGQLAFGGAQGSLSRGGAIEWLEWRGEGIEVRVEQFALDWKLAGLLEGRLDVRTLGAGRVHVRLLPVEEVPASDPFVMPAEVTLPVHLALRAGIDRVEIESIDSQGASSTVVLEGLVLRYDYDHVRHALALDSLAHGASHAQATVELGARDLALQARLAAFLRDPVEGVPLAMLAHAVAGGSLAGGEVARIEVELDALGQDPAAGGPDPARLLEELAGLRSRLEQLAGEAAPAAQLTAHALLHPWRSQPVESLQLRASRVNAAAFSAAAPRTDLGAEARVVPAQDEPEAWDFELSLANVAAGAWDAGLAPLRTLQASARLTPEVVDIASAHIELGAQPAGSIDLDGTLPLSGLAGADLDLRVQQLDLRAVMAFLPATQLAGSLGLSPLEQAGAAPGWQVRGGLTNALAGRLDQERLPLARLDVHVESMGELLRARALEMRIGDGALHLSGSFDAGTQALQVNGDVRRLPLAAIHRELASDMGARLSGTLGASGALDRVLAFRADIASDSDAGGRGEWEIRTVRLDGEWSPRRLRVRGIDIDALGARVAGHGIDVALPELASIEAHLSAQAPGLALAADAAMRERSGGGTLSLQIASLPQAVEWLRGLPLVGGALEGIDARGGTSLEAQWQGGWRQWLEGLEQPQRHPELSIDARLASSQLRLELPDGPAIDADDLEVVLRGSLAAASLAATGRVRMDQSAASLDIGVQMQRDAAGAPIPGWQLTFERFDVKATLPEQAGPWQLAVEDGLVVHVGSGRELEMHSTAGRLSLLPPQQLDPSRRPLVVSWEPLQFRQTAEGAMRLSSRGRIEGLQPRWLDALRDGSGAGMLEAAGFGSNLVLGAEWDLALLDTLVVHARLQREEGDLWLLGAARGRNSSAPPRDAILAGVRAVDVRVDSAADEVTLSADWESERAGIIHARAATRLARTAEGWSLPDEAPLAGQVDARLQDLSMWVMFAPPGWRVQGELAADLAIEGTVGRPLLRGSINGNGLNMRSVLDGLELYGGVLRARLEGERLAVEQLEFQGGTGSRAYVPGLSGNRTQAPKERGRMVAQGVVDWSGIGGAGAGSGITMDFNARLERMQVLVRNDRQLTLDGQLSAKLEAGTLQVRGDLEVIRATLLLPDAGAETLGDDVIIVRNQDELELIDVEDIGRATAHVESAQPMDMEVRLRLGRDLALQGLGITTRLEGELTLQSSARPDRSFSLIGKVRTDEGRYAAWGQSLVVENGEVTFNGDPENPTLALLAIRPDIDVRAGVRVSGTLRVPQLQLYSEPPLPEAETLSWIVLGRPTATGGSDGTSMQRAALGILAGQAVGSLADNIGVDELGLGESSVSVGKRITDELYLTYEQGLAGAASTLYIFYDITRRFTIRGASGEANAIDLIYTFDFD